MMKKTMAFAALALVSTALAAPLTAQEYKPADTALETDQFALDFTRGITTEIGARMPGTPDEARGRVWAMRWLNANGFTNVTDEPFMMDTWVRGEETAQITGEFAQTMAIAALGNSGSTGPDGIEAEVIGFNGVAELMAAPDSAVAGKIVFITHDMRPTQDGSSYGFAGPARWVGSGFAAQKGAVATVIRSVGTDNHRNPHTGGTSFPEGVTPTAAGALSNPDADNLERLLATGRPVTMRLVMTPQMIGETQSGNVVGEIVGRDPSLPPVLVACHLDSWDLGTGAIDDAAGCGIVAAAARWATQNGPALRTIRVLFAGAEETGLWGSKAYSIAHADEPIAVGLESDFGADRIWRFESNFRETNPDLHARLTAAVARFGVAGSTIVATGGADIDIARDQQTAIIDLQQDGTRYFDLHHTPDDTFDKIDPAQMRQNVAVWAQVVALLANEQDSIRDGGQ